MVIWLIIRASHEFIMTKIPLFLIVSFSIWWGCTVLTDFFIVPTIFKTIPDFFMAGGLGLKVFTKLNYLEVILAVFSLTLSLIPRREKVLMALSFLLLGISSTYIFYLTPKIQTLTLWWQEAESLGLTSLHGVADIQQDHQFFHRLYVWIDAVKLILLTSGIGFLIFKRNQVHA